MTANREILVNAKEIILGLEGKNKEEVKINLGLFGITDLRMLSSILAERDTGASEELRKVRRQITTEVQLQRRVRPEKQKALRCYQRVAEQIKEDEVCARIAEEFTRIYR